jgi:2-succinyl-5-enolpyruvyl-6-hydroxy-3-cyclohexene-1-carboxylate synthase
MLWRASGCSTLCGLRVCNTPLSLALADSAITDWSHHDERSSAFFALGIARTTGRPVVIVTTSGTAAAELHPALAEAVEGRVPLIAITADRPLRLRGLGAPQTIDQENLFGPSVKWAVDLETPADAAAALPLAARLWGEATAAPAARSTQPRFDEPLMPSEPCSRLRECPRTPSNPT